MIVAAVSQTINVNLSHSEAKRVAINYIYASFDWKGEYSIRLNEKDGKEWVFEKRVLYSSHSFETEICIREASDRDKIIYQFLKEIINT